jgi:hypothetical protein
LNVRYLASSAVCLEPSLSPDYQIYIETRLLKPVAALKLRVSRSQRLSPDDGSPRLLLRMQFGVSKQYTYTEWQGWRPLRKWLGLDAVVVCTFVVCLPIEKSLSVKMPATEHSTDVFIGVIENKQVIRLLLIEFVTR